MARSGRVLIIDDDAPRAEELAARIKEGGYAVDTLTDMEKALSRGNAISREFDVVLCEQDIAGVSWDHVRKRVADMDVQTPSIMLCNDAKGHRIMTALRLGASDFFVRPIEDLDTLFDSIDRCVNQRRLRRELSESRRRLEVANAELRGTVQMLEQDQQAGRQVQLRMLPATPLIIDDYVFSHTVIPSLYLSGDFTDYFTVGENSITFFIADVSGHGSSSAFCTVLLKNLFARKRSDYMRQSDDTVTSPVAMLKRANFELMEVGVGKFATMVVGNVDLENNTLRYSIAGHLPQPVLVNGEGARYLAGEGPAVGLMDDAHYEEHLIDLPDSFMLALFSDGILEILPPDNLIDKERYFLEAFDHTSDSPLDVVHMLGLDRVETAPDDIAALFISKRG